jgi:23S rRNA (uracil1939-C5)-methyltransferase
LTEALRGRGVGGIVKAAEGDDIVRVERIAAGGDGVGRQASGRVVFVPRTAPGDVVRVDIDEAKPRWARGRASVYVERGPGVRKAPCPVYADCGGCRLQHLEPDEQRKTKRDLVQETLRRIGRIQAEVPPLIAAGDEFAYRNRVTFSAGMLDGRPVAGYRAIRDPEVVVDVAECLLAEAPIVSAWRALRENWDSGLSEILASPDARLTLRCSSAGAVDVLVRGVARRGPEVPRALVDRVPELVGWHEADVSGPPRCVAGDELLLDRWQGVDFALPADVFLQVNRSVSSAMDGWLDERAGDWDGWTVLDLYAGVGARAIRWARDGARVIACEVSSRASSACRRAATDTGGRLEVLTGRVEERIGRLPSADLVVVNPPRAGLSREVAQALARAPAQRLAYVSCDPATLARDLDRLREAWILREVQPFDAFPQTAHVETVAWCLRA